MAGADRARGGQGEGLGFYWKLTGKTLEDF